jgi:Mg-chelatase subunit ChlD
MTALLLAAVIASQAARPAVPLDVVDVVLMVDVSHSVAYGVIKRDRLLLHDAGSALADAFEPGDAVRVGTFGREIVLDRTRLHDAAAIRAAADALGDRIGGASPIWDALVTAADALQDGTGRRAILLVTDGRSTANRIGFAEALDRLQRARVPVFVVSLDRNARPLPDPGARLTKLADTTGGTCLFVERPALAGAIRRAMTTLRAGVSGPGPRGTVR